MTKFERWSVIGSSFLTVVTGVGYFVTKYLLATEDPFSVVAHPWQPWFLKAHIVVSPLLIFALGLVALRHVWVHIRNGTRPGRRTGLTLAFAVAPMILTGYLIQVFTAQGWVTAMAISHIVFGALYAVAFTAHQYLVGAWPRRRDWTGDG